MDSRLPLIDLHRHLDGNMRLGTILDLARQHRIRLPADTAEGLRPYVQVMSTVPDLLAFLGKFEWMIAVLADVDAAIVGGGRSLYEAIAAGVPAVGVAVVSAQVPTVRAFAARRLAIDGGPVSEPSVAGRRVVRAFAALQADAAWRRRVRTEGPRAVDGRGAQRVARAITTLTEANVSA